MNEDIMMILDMTKESMEKSLVHLDEALAQIRAGKADPRILDSITVEYYGSETPLNQVANVNSPDARTLKVQPWERTLIGAIEKAILTSNLGLNPSNNGESIIINIPALTEERRVDLVKQARGQGEHTKVSIRNNRKDAIDQFKQMLKDGLSEDLEKDAEAEVQKLTDKYTRQIEEMVKKKEEDIMKV